MNIVTRAYNSWEFDSLTGTLKKSSTDDKILDEISYYQNIPPRFQIFYPKLVGFNVLEKWLKIERYDYLSLAEYVLGQSDSPLLAADWDEVMANLRAILRLWNIPSRLGVADDAYAMYISKTAREYSKFKEQNVWPELFNTDTIVINGVEHKNFSTLWPDIRAYIQDSLIPSYYVSFIHGDFCFGNMLYGSRGALRFVDPRGSFGSKGCYGDQRYDVAKLYHSVVGGYDYLNNDKFRAIHLEENSWEYILNSIAPWRSLEEAKAAFITHFFDGPNVFNEKDITLIAGLIMIGSAARHYENPRRQLALYLIGIEMLNKVMIL